MKKLIVCVCLSIAAAFGERTCTEPAVAELIGYSNVFVGDYGFTSYVSTEGWAIVQTPTKNWAIPLDVEWGRQALANIRAAKAGQKSIYITPCTKETVNGNVTYNIPRNMSVVYP
jgi:hypothetical protein